MRYILSSAAVAEFQGRGQVRIPGYQDLTPLPPVAFKKTHTALGMMPMEQLCKHLSDAVKDFGHQDVITPGGSYRVVAERGDDGPTYGQ